MTPHDELPGVGGLGLRSWVNGEPRQDSSTADVLDTGTPEGVALSGRFPYLGAGDVMEIEIDGLGRQRQELVAKT